MSTLTPYYQRRVSEQLSFSKASVQKFLRKPEELTTEQAKGIVGTYRLAIEPNFIPWMKLAERTVDNGKARELIAQNIRDEIKDNHPLMLRQFAKNCGVHINDDDYDRALEPVVNMWRLFAEDSSIMNLAVAATLENTSLVFVPYLAELGKKLGCQDFQYTEKHGQADVKHADELAEGLVEEIVARKLQRKDSMLPLVSAVDRTVEFLQVILTPNPIQQT